MGGGVMRTAASKTAASWAARSGMNRAGSSIGRRSSVPPPYASAAVEPGLISVQNGEAKGVDESGISQWEDDWEFAGWMEKEGGEELVLEPPPRLVFGPAPTIEEAKEATDDLKCALETAYFSEGAQESKKNEQGQNDLFTNNPIIPAMPRGVIQAFSLLQSSPEAQSVVASLASDKAIWDAVMKNDKVMEFYRNNQSSLTENIFEDSSKTNPTDNSDDNTTFEEASKEENGFVSFVTNMKEKAMEVVNNVSNLIQNVFGMKSENEAESSETGESDGGNKFMDFILTPHNTFLGLAIAVIFIVLLKRPGP